MSRFLKQKNIQEAVSDCFSPTTILKTSWKSDEACVFIVMVLMSFLMKHLKPCTKRNLNEANVD